MMMTAHTIVDSVRVTLNVFQKKSVVMDLGVAIDEYALILFLMLATHV